MDLRSDFPALAEGLAHFDGPGGTQVPAVVAEAVAASYRSAVSNRHGGFTSSGRADGIVDAARSAAADLLGADPRGIVLGHSMTANTYVLAGALAKKWSPGEHLMTALQAQKHHKTHPFADIELVSYESLPSNLGGYEAKRFSVVVLDEVGSIKGATTRHKAVAAVTAGAHRVVGMTATPLENHLDETHALLQACRVPGLPGTGAWGQKFVVYEPTTILVGGRPQITNKPVGVKPSGLAELRKYLPTVVLRRTAEAAGLTMPAVDGVTHSLPLSPSQAKAYAEASKRLKGLARHQALQDICNVHDDDSTKARRAVELIAEDESKAIVYAFNLDHLDVCEALLAEKGIGYVRIDGGVTKLRQERLAAFKADPLVRVLLGNIVLERGLNLQHCPRLISLGVEWNPARNAQRVGRICRIGSPFTSVRHDIVVTESQSDENRISISKQRERDFNAVFGGWNA